MIAVRQIITLPVISSNSVRIACVCCAMQVALRGMVYRHCNGDQWREPHLGRRMVVCCLDAVRELSPDSFLLNLLTGHSGTHVQFLMSYGLYRKTSFCSSRLIGGLRYDALSRVVLCLPSLLCGTISKPF